MCPNCRAFINSSDRVCPYCQVQLGPRAIDLRSAETLQSFLPKAYATSIIILTLNFAFYFAMAVVSVRVSQQPLGEALGQVWGGFSGGVLRAFGAKFAPDIYQYGQWWRLIMAGFLHGSLLHIAMNTWVMFDLVAEVEQFYGSSRLVIIYIFSTFTGFLLSLLWAPMTISIGASAACFGLIGAMMAIGLRRADPLAQAIRSYYRRWAIYGLIFSFMPFMRIDVAAHLGGLAGGFIIGFLGGLPGLPNSPRERLWKGVAGVTLLVTVYCFLRDFQFLYAVLGRQS
jgi:membrane associated rhomboid family serine protease